MMKTPSSRILVVLLSSGISSSLSHAAGVRPATRLHERVSAAIQNVEVVPGVNALRASVAPNLFDTVSAGGAVHLVGFPLADGVAVDLELAPFEVMAPDAVVVAGGAGGDVVLPRPAVTLLKGAVANEAGSTAFLAVTPTGVEGWVQSRGQMYVVARNPQTTANGVAISPSSALPVDTSWKCAAENLPQVNLPEFPAPAGGLRTGNCWTANIAIDADFEFLQLFGGNTANATAYITTLFGAINTIYERDLDTHLQLSYVRVWPTSADPYTQSDIQQQLYQFRDYWNTNMATVPRVTSHLLSGRSLGGGIAYLNALCGYSSGYGVSANIRGTFPTPLTPNTGNWDLVVVAHEIGHNFGSPHTHCYNPPIDTCYSGECYVGTEALPAGGLGTLMSYCHTLPGGLANIDLSFHARCQTQMLGFMAMLKTNNFCDMSAACSGVTCDVADANCDGTVDGGDVLVVRAPGTWNVPPANADNPRGDVNKDGAINGGDILSIRAAGTWNTSTGPCTCP